MNSSSYLPRIGIGILLLFFNVEEDLLFLCECRLGLPVSYVLPCSLLQASRRELFPGKDSRFLLHAFIWCKCFDWNCSNWRDDPFGISILCQNYISQQLVDVHDGLLRFLLICLYQLLSLCCQKIIFPACPNTQVYVWSKQNPFIHMSFLGLFTFTAAYLPWVSVVIYSLSFYTLLQVSTLWKVDEFVSQGQIVT